MRKLLLALLCCAALTACGEKEAPPPPETPPVEIVAEPEAEEIVEEEAPPAPTVATLAVCGDTMSHMPITNDVWDAEAGKYDYARVMSGAADAVSAADYAVANLETTLSGGPDYSGFPFFNSPDDLARGLAEIGFDLCLTANNHSLDKGFAGLSRTLDVLDENGLAHVGTHRTAEEAETPWVIADVGGISVAFLGYTYGTNGLAIPKDHPYSINVFNTDYMTSLADPDTERLAADLAAVQALDTDLVAVMIHWGVEYQTSPSRHQTELADFLIENGADLVLGGHSHVPQPMEYRTLPDGRQGFVCYSLGNFLSSQNDPLTDTTAVLTLELTRDNVTGETEVTDCSYLPLYMLDRESGARPRFQLMDAYAELAGGAEGALAAKLEKAISDCHAIFGAQFDPQADAQS